MRVLSLFDGMACGYEALKRASIPVTEYHAFEIDKYAIQVAKKNHPDIIHHGEITFMTDFTQFRGFDLLIGGSPCQGFSVAGKGLNFNDPRSQLFFEFVRAKREAKPRFFMLENVKMKKEWLAVIDEHLGVKSVVINSALVSAQNRVRHYWCNWSVSQPADRGIYLRDIIETGEVGDSHTLSTTAMNGLSRKTYSAPQVIPDKTGTLNTKNNSGQLSLDSGTTLIPVNHPEKLVNVHPTGNGMNGWVYGVDAKSHTLTTNKGEGNKIGKRTVGKDSVLVRKINPSKKCGGKQPHMQDRIYCVEGKSVACTASFGGSINVGRVVGRADDKFGHDIQRRIYSEEGKSPSLLGITTGGGIPPKIQTATGERMLEGITYRKLTPVECERLQTIPDNYTASVSNTQRYRMLGNGWTVEVIAHIFREMPL